MSAWLHTCWPHVLTAGFEISRSSWAVSCNPQGLLVLLWITDRCLREDLSLSSGLHKGSAVVYRPHAHHGWMILSSRSCPLLPHWHLTACFLCLLPPCGRNLPHGTAPQQKGAVVFNLAALFPPFLLSPTSSLLPLCAFFISVWCNVWKLQLIAMNRIASVCPPKGYVCLWAVHAWRLLSD